MISQTVEYSLRAMIALASDYNGLMTVREIATATKIPRPYLSKMMRNLVRAGLVQSRRGLTGGFKLSHPPEKISIWDVIQAIDPKQRLAFCPLNIETHTNPCALHRVINRVADQMEVAFRNVSLADIVLDCVDMKLVKCTRVPSSPNQD